MQTSENQQALSKILDMSRLIAITVLSLHFYYVCYSAFEAWKLVSPFSNKLLDNLVRTKLFDPFHKAKLIALCFLAISLLGVKGKKKEDLHVKTGLYRIGAGLVRYFISYVIFGWIFGAKTTAILYIAVTSLGFIFLISGDARFKSDQFAHQQQGYF